MYGCDHSIGIFIHMDNILLHFFLVKNIWTHKKNNYIKNII